MNGRAIMTGAYLVSMGVPTYKWVINGYVPLPYNYIRVSISYAVLSLVGMVSEELAALFAVGYLLALLMRNVSQGKGSGTFKFTQKGGLIEWMPPTTSNPQSLLGGLSSSQDNFAYNTDLYLANALTFGANPAAQKQGG